MRYSYVEKVWSPAPLTTTFVAVGLLLSAGFAAVAAGFVESPIPPTATSWVCYFLGSIFIWRAIGDFRYVGYFKRVGDPPFSRLDNWLYSPVITLMGLGFYYLA